MVHFWLCQYILPSGLVLYASKSVSFAIFLRLRIPHCDGAKTDYAKARTELTSMMGVEQRHRIT